MRRDSSKYEKFLHPLPSQPSTHDIFTRMTVCKETPMTNPAIKKFIEEQSSLDAAKLLAYANKFFAVIDLREDFKGWPAENLKLLERIIKESTTEDAYSAFWNILALDLIEWN